MNSLLARRAQRIFCEKYGVKVTVLSQIGLPSLLKIVVVTPHKQLWRNVFHPSFVCLSTWPPLASIVLALGGIYSLRQTPEEICGLENVTRAT